MKSWTMVLGLSCLAAINASAQQGGLDLDQAIARAREMTTEARPGIDAAAQRPAASMVTLGEAAMEDDSIRLAIQELFLNDDDDAIKLSGMNILWPRIAIDAAVRAADRRGPRRGRRHRRFG